MNPIPTISRFIALLRGLVGSNVETQIREAPRQLTDREIESNMLFINQSLMEINSQLEVKLATRLETQIREARRPLTEREFLNDVRSINQSLMELSAQLETEWESKRDRRVGTN